MRQRTGILGLAILALVGAHGVAAWPLSLGFAWCTAIAICMVMAEPEEK